MFSSVAKTDSVKFISNPNFGLRQDEAKVKAFLSRFCFCYSSCD